MERFLNLTRVRIGSYQLIEENQNWKVDIYFNSIVVWRCSSMTVFKDWTFWTVRCHRVNCCFHVLFQILSFMHYKIKCHVVLKCSSLIVMECLQFKYCSHTLTPMCDTMTKKHFKKSPSLWTAATQQQKFHTDDVKSVRNPAMIRRRWSSHSLRMTDKRQNKCNESSVP